MDTRDFVDQSSISIPFLSAALQPTSVSIASGEIGPSSAALDAGTVTSSAPLPPVANNDTGLTTTQVTALVIPASTLLANDTDPNGQTLTIAGVSAASNGTAVFNAVANTITYTPNAGYTGPGGFTYTIQDTSGLTASATVGLNVTAPGTAQTLFPASTTPTTPSGNDPSPVALGVQPATAAVVPTSAAISVAISANPAPASPLSIPASAPSEVPSIQSSPIPTVPVQTVTPNPIGTTPAVDPNATAPINAAAQNLAQTSSLAQSQNPIVLENQKPGTPVSVWGLHGSLNGLGDTNIEGFATQISVNQGQTESFKIDTNSKSYRIDIYRLGYYGGDGATLVTSFNENLSSPQVQPNPLFDPSTNEVDAGNWSVSASWNVPSTATSGVYIAKLTRTDGTSGQNIIPFVVRSDGTPSDITFQTSDSTWQAYNSYGGYNLYTGPDGSTTDRANAVSYNRPILTNSTAGEAGPQDFVFGEELPAISWLEQNGYDVSYISSVDAASNPSSVLNSKIYMDVGHDEYWSQSQYNNVKAASDAGVNLAFLSGNQTYWDVQYAPSLDSSATPNRTIVEYKDPWDNTQLDPNGTSNGGSSTFRDPVYGPGTPENSLAGTIFQVDGSSTLGSIDVPSQYSNLSIWKNTAVANLQPGQSVTLANLLGYEWDTDNNNGFRPAGLIDLSSTAANVGTLIINQAGNVTGSGEATHSLTLYRDSKSGALIFSTGTVMWSWGLSAQHALYLSQTAPVSSTVQQAMVNLFAEMGVQPATLQASLVLATQSADKSPPVSTITSVAGGQALMSDQIATIAGTAADVGGGTVAGVEISTDGGTTWNRATGTTQWTYSWVVPKAGTYTIETRASDDNAFTEVPSDGVQVTVGASNTTSLFSKSPGDVIPYSSVADNQNSGDASSVELGVTFKVGVSGTISAIRFYKGVGDTGAHTASLWTSAGTLLATGASTNETASGWQTVTFAQPISVAAGQTYVASFHSSGDYVADSNYFAAPLTSGNLSTGADAGVYQYGASTTFPKQSTSDGSNYWVDVQFTPGNSTPLPPVANNDTGLTTAENTALVIPASTLLANDTDPNGQILTITGVSAPSNGTAVFNAAANTITYTPNAGYTGPGGFTYTIRDTSGLTASATVGLNVTAPGTAQTLFPASTTPTTPSENDPSPVELGVKFSASTGGMISSISYYKSPNDTGTHTGTLWTSSGTVLATGTFTNETASGWQTLTFASPVSVTAGTTYVAGFHSNGDYAATANFFTAPYTSGNLTAPVNAGVYNYGASGTFPTSTFSATNYDVSVQFTPGNSTPLPPVANNDTGLTTTENTALVIPASTLLANDTDPNGQTLTITGVSAPSNGTAVFNAAANTITYTPNAGYTGPGGFTYTIQDTSGLTASATVGLNVTAPGTAQTLFPASTTPTTPSENDPSPVELGVKFSASTSGTITGVSYYKSPDDTGTHTGTLWSSTGTVLATGTFTNETASGWQTLTFTSPVSITAGTTYVAGFHSNGDYAATANFFTTPYTNGTLTAPVNAGVYSYGAAGAFPTSTFSATNYDVSVQFAPAGSTPLPPVANNDTGLTTTENTALVIPASTLLANDTDPNGQTLAITGVSAPSNGTAVFNAAANTITYTPNAGYTGPGGFTYTIRDTSGLTASATVGLNVTAPGTAQTLFPASTTPTTPSENDPKPVELGVKFSASTSGTITGVSYYKSPSDTGTHTGTLWSSTGTVLATGTFTNETASGWQTLTFASPVSVTAGTTYVAGFHSNGDYAATPNFFTTPYTNGNLTAPVNAGVYKYGASGAFPTSTFSATNYDVSVQFTPAGSTQSQVANSGSLATTQSIALATPTSSPPNSGTSNTVPNTPASAAPVAAGISVQGPASQATPTTTGATGTASGASSVEGQTAPPAGVGTALTQTTVANDGPVTAQVTAPNLDPSSTVPSTQDSFNGVGTGPVTAQALKAPVAALRLPQATPLTLAFDSTVSFSSPTTATLTGTVLDSAGAASIELFEGTTDLGSATVNPDGTWSFTDNFAPGLHTALNAVATDASGDSASASSDYTLTTGTRSATPGQPYTAFQDRYGPTGTFEGQTFFERNGAVLFSSSFAALSDGGSSYRYSGGMFFKDKTYSSFVDVYDANGTLAQDIEINRDGSHIIEADASGQHVHSIGSDLFANNASNEHFVFSKGFGHDTIADFQVAGPGHDTITLPSSDIMHLGRIIGEARTVGGDTTLHIDNHDSITLTGVTVSELEAHKQDFRFHA